MEDCKMMMDGMGDKQAIVAALQSLIEMLNGAPEEPEMEMAPEMEMEGSGLEPEMEVGEEEVLEEPASGAVMKKKKYVAK